MSWAVFYKIDSSTFKDLYTKGQTWGDLAIMKLTVGGTEIYGAGVYGAEATPVRLSPKVGISYGAPLKKARITINALALADANSDGVVALSLWAWKNDELTVAPGQYGIFVSTVPLSNQNPYTLTRKVTMVVEIDGNTVHVTLDGSDLGTYTLDAVPTSFSVGVIIQSVTAGSVGIVITEVIGEYYVPPSPPTNTYSMVPWIVVIIIVILIILYILRPRGGE